jgi:predicted PurR-regulated permease PerM
MAFNLPVIIKLVKQLGVLLIGSAPLIEGIKGFIPKDDKRKDSERLNDLEEAMSMQSNLNEQYENQMKVVQSTLEKVEKSLKILVYVSTGAAVLAFVAIIIAILK